MGSSFQLFRKGESDFVSKRIDRNQSMRGWCFLWEICNNNSMLSNRCTLNVSGALPFASLKRKVWLLIMFNIRFLGNRKCSKEITVLFHQVVPQCIRRTRFRSLTLVIHVSLIRGKCKSVEYRDHLYGQYTCCIAYCSILYVHAKNMGRNGKEKQNWTEYNVAGKEWGNNEKPFHHSFVGNLVL